MTQTGTLPIGLVIDGQRHTAFELRSATLGDNIEAIETLGDVSSLRVSAFVYSKQLLALGTLPKEQINADLVLSLSPDDFEALQLAQELLKKKLHEFGLPSKLGTSSAPSASATA
jgi:hypothetical protein